MLTKQKQFGVSITISEKSKALFSQIYFSLYIFISKEHIKS